MPNSGPVKTIPVQEAVGAVLCHDITRIVPGESKGPVFRKGHVITEEDISVLLDVGKENIYVYLPEQGVLHEDDAALRIARATGGQNLFFSAPKEGRVNFHASCQGLLRVDVDALEAVNSLGEIALATLHTMQEVKKGQAVAGTRVIPLVIAQNKIERMEELVHAPIVEVLPFRSARVGLITTGSEIYHGRIQDSFGPVVKEKFHRLGSKVIGQTLTSDDVDKTRDAIFDFLRQGADMLVLTGGMSVDPDDRTPASIRASGAKVVSYGAPTFPGAMFLLAFLSWNGAEIPILGLPGCVMYHKATIFDLIVPRLLAGIPVTARDIAALGHGGFCASCAECRYPVCPFGKN